MIDFNDVYVVPSYGEYVSERIVLENGELVKIYELKNEIDVAFISNTSYKEFVKECMLYGYEVKMKE